MSEEPVPEWRKAMNMPLVRESNLNDDLRTEVLDLLANSVEKSQRNIEAINQRRYKTLE